MGTELSLEVEAGLDAGTLEQMLEALRDFVGAALSEERMLELDHEDVCPEDLVRAMCGDELLDDHRIDGTAVLPGVMGVEGAPACPAVGADDHYDCSVRDASGDVVVRVLGYRTTALPGPLPDDLRRPLAAALDR